MAAGVGGVDNHLPNTQTALQQMPVTTSVSIPTPSSLPGHRPRITLMTCHSQELCKHPHKHLLKEGRVWQHWQASQDRLVAFAHLGSSGDSSAPPTPRSLHADSYLWAAGLAVPSAWGTAPPKSHGCLASPGFTNRHLHTTFSPS